MKRWLFRIGIGAAAILTTSLLLAIAFVFSFEGSLPSYRGTVAAMGWPIVGDGIYGKTPRLGGPGLQLHAREIVVPLYKNRAPIRVSAPVPLHMSERLRACGWPGEVYRLI